MHEYDGLVELLNAGQSEGSVAEIYGVSNVTISHISLGRTWSSVTGIKFCPTYASVTGELISRGNELRASGRTIVEVAEELGVSKATVFRHTKRGGFSTVEGALNA